MRALTLIATVTLCVALSSAQPATAYVVDSAGDAPDGCFTDGICDTGPLCVPNGVCTLRAALQEANLAGGGTITFAIGSGLQTIQPTSVLPGLIAPNIVIDGTTQPGPPGWNPCVYPGTPLIEIDGSLAPPGAGGLVLFGGNAVVKGLVINRFTVDQTNTPLCTGGVGIVVRSDDNTIQCNLVGTDATGLLAAGNEGGGIALSLANGNMIGGGVVAERNVVAANGYAAGTCSPLQGISINDGGTNTVMRNYIGTDVTGDVGFGNGVNGCIVAQSVGNLIASNVISGHNDEGVDIIGGATLGLASNNLVTENFIGTNHDGTVAIPNRQGVRIFRADHNLVSDNVVSGNLVDGVVIDRGEANVVLGNRVGTVAGGLSPLPNGRHGVRLSSDSLNNVVGGTLGVTAGGPCTGFCNVIAYNGGVGLAMNLGLAGNTSGGNAFRANSIFRNGPTLSGLGINLGTILPPNPNDVGDADTGPNGLQNFPDLTSAVATIGGIVVSGTLDSTPNTTFAVEIFASDACDPLLHGEGGTWLGTVNVTTPAVGPAPFSITVPTSTVFPGGPVLTATATDLTTNDTSEFSPCLSVPLDHFSCHKTFEYPSPSFTGFLSLPATDRFVSRNLRSRAVLGLCAPTNKNGEDPTAPTHAIHLEGYKIRPVTYSPTPSSMDLILKDQFGTFPSTIYLPKPAYLLTPTAKSLTSLYPLPPTPGVVDDFLCYRLRQYLGGNFPQVNAPLSTVDQFGPDAFTWRRARWLCTPVSVNLQNPTAPAHPDQLTCYQVPANQATNWNVNVWVGNQFGVEALRVQKQNMLCVPSRIGCVGVCVGGTAPGQLCAEDANCPGLGTCDVPACCCAPNGATECTTDADCPASRCECS